MSSNSWVHMTWRDLKSVGHLGSYLLIYFSSKWGRLKVASKASLATALSQNNLLKSYSRATNKTHFRFSFEFPNLMTLKLSHCTYLLSYLNFTLHLNLWILRYQPYFPEFFCRTQDQWQEGHQLPMQTWHRSFWREKFDNFCLV